MSLNEALQGKAYEAIPFVVDAGRVAAFAAAIGHPGSDVPPTFATAPELAAGLANVIVDPELGLDLADVLHGEQEFAWLRPLRVGETLRAQATIESIRGRGTTWFLTLRTELRDAAEQPVVRCRSTLVVREDA